MGGDDYELCFTAPASAAFAIEQALAACEVTGTVVGQLVAGSGLQFATPEGEAYVPAAAGFQHFQGVH